MKRIIFFLMLATLHVIPKRVQHLANIALRLLYFNNDTYIGSFYILKSLKTLSDLNSNPCTRAIK